MGLGLRIVAGNLGVDPSTVSELFPCSNLQEAYMQKRPYPKDARPNKKLTKTVQLTVLHKVLQ